MKLLIFDQYSDPGGAQLCLADLLPAFQERRWQVLTGFPGNGKLFEQVRAAGFKAECVDIRLPWELRSLERRWRPDVIYLNGPRILPAAAVAGLHGPIVFHSHSVLKPASHLVARLSLGILKARIMASSRFVAGKWGPTVTVVYNGASGPPAGHRHHASPHLRVGCIGRISPAKGQLEFV